MSISIFCPSCGAASFVGNELAGRQARCPHCGNTFSVPAPVQGGMPINAPVMQTMQPKSAGLKPLWIILSIVAILIIGGVSYGLIISAQLKSGLVGNWHLARPTNKLSGATIHFRADHTYDASITQTKPGMSRTTSFQGTWRVTLFELYQTNEGIIFNGRPKEWTVGRIKEASATRLVIGTDNGDEIYARDAGE